MLLSSSSLPSKQDSWPVLPHLNRLTSIARRNKLQVSLAQIKKQQTQHVLILNSLSGEVSTTTSTGKLRVAYQGVPGAYSEFAAKTAWPDCITVPCRVLTDAITAVETGRADGAVLPAESTKEGTALQNYGLLLRHDVSIVQELNLFVHYCLLAIPGVKKGELKRVISHPMALAQCNRTLARLGLDCESVEDTAGAVKLLLSHKMLDTAAIASSRAASLYGLNILAHGLQDESWNVTRFLILSRVPRIMWENRFRIKTSMVVAHHNETLTLLLKVLSAFSSRNINLTKLEVNNPSKDDGLVMMLDVQGGFYKEFPCVLYVDFEGSMADQKVKDAIAEISKSPVFIRILGCYAADPNIYGLQ
uniref:prephenate dehydratase n=1 Tax=Nelumbo nucifera TaxID=4432 RepID=A0A822ZRZ4_NELNU|nr:TPA_asm: hypothetical protein HUJ06_017959 [Nelumbo nucifera]